MAHVEALPLEKPGPRVGRIHGHRLGAVGANLGHPLRRDEIHFEIHGSQRGHSGPERHHGAARHEPDARG